jgi:Ser/Thr protein kinase RdoA (MazF antagonist)
MTDYYSLEPAEQAERLEVAGHDVLQHWGIADAELSLIKHRENAVFEVKKDDFRAALRLHRHGYHTGDELRSELQWMQALSAAGIKVPEIIPAASGELFVGYSANGLPGELQIDLFEWIDGEQLGSVEEGVADESEVERTFGTLGELAARVHNQATTWTLPDGFTRHAWDADGLAGEDPFWGRFWEIDAATAEQRQILQKARDRIHQELAALPKSPGSYSMIHADFAAENIHGEPYFERARSALIEGYRKHRQLTDEDLNLLPLFFLARSTTYVGWVHTRSETDTAKELTPMILEMTCGLAEDYLET